MLEKFRFNRVGLDEEKSGNMLEKLKWGAGGRRFKSSRPDQFLAGHDRAGLCRDARHLDSSRYKSARVSRRSKKGAGDCPYTITSILLYQGKSSARRRADPAGQRDSVGSNEDENALWSDRRPRRR